MDKRIIPLPCLFHIKPFNVFAYLSTQNLPHISAWTYSYSKQILWETFFWISSRLCHSGEAFSRLIFSDTDSLFLSHQRPSTQLELLEKKCLRETNAEIPYHRSLVAYMLTNQFIRTMAPILDWSSIFNPNSFVLRNLLEQSDATSAQIEYLAHKTRNKHFKWKCEVTPASDGQTDGRTDGRTDGQTDGRTDPLIELCVCN